MDFITQQGWLDLSENYLHFSPFCLEDNINANSLRNLDFGVKEMINLVPYSSRNNTNKSCDIIWLEESHKMAEKTYFTGADI